MSVKKEQAVPRSFLNAEQTAKLVGIILTVDTVLSLRSLGHEFYRG